MLVLFQKCALLLLAMASASANWESRYIAKCLSLVLLFQGHLQKVWQHQTFTGAWHDEVPPLPPRAEGVRRCHQHWSAQHPVEDQVFEISYIFWVLSLASTKCCQYLHCTFRKTSEKAPYKGPKSALQIFGFKMTPPPPPFGTFPKIHLIR